MNIISAIVSSVMSFVVSFTGVSYGAPSTDLVYQKTILPIADSLYDLGTSTKAWRDGFFDELCLTGDSCITAWPSGSGSATFPSLTDVPDSIYTGNAGKLLSVNGTEDGIGVTDINTARTLISSTATGLSYDSGTGVFSLTTGYSIPLTASTTEWHSAYTNRITTATYPLVLSANTLSLAFGTTTSNTWAGTQTFTNAPVFSSLTNGLVYANGSGQLTSVATSTWTFASSTLLADNNTWSGTNAFGVLSATYASTTQIGSTGSAYFATSGGNVGIGTTSPATKLHINEPAGVAGNYGLRISNSGMTSGYGELTIDSTNAVIKLLASGSTYPLAFNVNGSERLRITTAGNVGIGTTTPYSRLTTWGTGSLFEAVTNASTTVFSIGQSGATTTALAVTSGLTLTGSASNIALGSNYLSGDGGDEGVYVDSTGRVGLGTTTPGSTLSIQNVANFVSSAVSTIYNGLNIMTTLIIPNSATQSPTASAQIAIDTTSYQVKYGDGSTTRVLGNGYTYPAFSYATTTTWTGTTTIPLGTAFIGETWSGIQCFTDVGTVQVSIYDGTNRMNWLNASTTVGTVALSTNNTFTAAEKRYVDIGTPASSPTKVSCTVKKAITAD